MDLTCKICNKVFSNQSNLRKHYKNVHNIIANTFSSQNFHYKCLEEDCNNSYRMCSQLTDHLITMHNVAIEEEELKFNSIEDFTIWKSNIEEEESCNYIRPRGKHTLHSGTELMYYYCNRSGKSRIVTLQGTSQNSRKSRGSMKLNRACVSQIVLRINKNGRIHVSRIKTHYGHLKEMQHLRIGSSHRQEIASRLMSGATVTNILDQYKSNINTDLKRIDLLTKQDIRNIKRSFKLEMEDNVKYIETIHSLVTECCTDISSSNPVLFYKQQGQHVEGFDDDDFCLIVMNEMQASLLLNFGGNILAIDSTHDLNNYDFEMITVLVVDEFNEGFPVAFLFSNRKDTFIYKYFFQTIKDKVGVISCTTFMSDITNTYNHAWMMIMGEVDNHLYSSWHVDRAWRRLLSKIENKKKRQQVYKILKNMQQNPNQTKFEIDFTKTILYLFHDEETQQFADCFSSDYADVYTKWAYCYRCNCGITPNIKLESLHRVIKYFYLRKKSVKMLINGFNATLKYLRDKIVDRLIKLAKGKPIISNKYIDNHHILAVTSVFNISKEAGGVWKISSKSGENIIQKASGRLKCCDLICRFCNICIHAYSCNCADFLMNSLLCKHIHFMVLNSSEVDRNTNENVNVGQENEIKECANFLDVSETNEDIKQNLLTEVTAAHTKLSVINGISSDTFEQILSHLNAIRSLLNSTVKENLAYK